MIVTEPGVYDLDEADYHGDPVPEGSLSCSGAKLLMPPGSPARFAYARKHPPAPTKSMEFGTAAHREVLGTGWPIAVLDAPDWTKRDAQEWRKKQRAAGLVPILAREREQITEMAAQIRAHPAARVLLGAGDVLNEQSLFWYDSEFGIWRRCRMDAVRLPGRVIITDYKTARSADPGVFARDAANLRYHWQDAWYREAVTQTLGDYDPAFVFIVQEKDPPYLVGIYELSADDVFAGYEQTRSACVRYAECMESGEWPGPSRPGQRSTRSTCPGGRSNREEA